MEGRWADVPCDQVTPLAVQQWLMGLTRPAAKAARDRMAQVMDYAVLYGHVDVNPMSARYSMPGAQTAARRDDGTWDAAGLGEVWRAVAGTYLEGAVLMMAFGGCRVGEALAVRSEDVEPVDGLAVPVALVQVASQVDSHGRLVARTKTPQSVRVAALVGEPAVRVVQIARSGAAWLSDDGLGRPIPQQVARTQFARMLSEAGVDVHPLKQLRKSWQTVARWRLRLAPEYTEPLMGHKLPGVTGTYYDRPDGQAFAEVLSDAYAAHAVAEYPWAVRRFGTNWDAL